MDLVGLPEEFLLHHLCAPGDVGLVEVDGCRGIENGILDLRQGAKHEHLLRDAHRATGKTDDVPVFLSLGDDPLKGDHLRVDVVMFRRVGILGPPIFVETVDVYMTAARLTVVGCAVADKHDRFLGLPGNWPLVGAKDDMHVRHFLVALAVVLAKNLNRLFQGAWASPPAVVGLFLFRRRPRVCGNVRPFEVLFDADKANLKTCGAPLCLF